MSPADIQKVRARVATDLRQKQINFSKTSTGKKLIMQLNK